MTRGLIMQINRIIICSILMLSSHLDLKSMSMNHEGLYAVSIPKDKAQKNLVLEFIKDKASYVKKADYIICENLADKITLIRFIVFHDDMGSYGYIDVTYEKNGEVYAFIIVDPYYAIGSEHWSQELFTEKDFSVDSFTFDYCRVNFSELDAFAGHWASEYFDSQDILKEEYNEYNWNPTFMYWLLKQGYPVYRRSFDGRLTVRGNFGFKSIFDTL